MLALVTTWSKCVTVVSVASTETRAEPGRSAAIVEVAARLLRRAAARARSPPARSPPAAGVQAPTIYRLFGDKDGLLDAVAEHVFSAYVAGKAPSATHGRPGRRSPRRVGHAHRLRPGQRGAVRAPRRPRAAAPAHRPPPPAWRSCAVRVRRIAAAGRLKVAEERAVELIHAAGTGAVLTLLASPAAAPGPRPRRRDVRGGDAGDPHRRARHPRRWDTAAAAASRSGPGSAISRPLSARRARSAGGVAGPDHRRVARSSANRTKGH